MAKPIKVKLKLQLPAGSATAAPPVGTALGPHGVNIGDFVKRYNEATSGMAGDIVPVEITIYEDRSFDFALKTPPASALLRKAARPLGEARPNGAAGLEKGSGTPKRTIVGTVTRANIRAIAEKKMPDLNAESPEAAESIIEGTARSMGIEVQG